MSDDIETWLRAQVDDDETLAESDYDIMISARKVRDVAAEITCLRAALATARREGMDIEPTRAMLDAARDWSLSKYHQGIGDDAAAGCYRAMRAAAIRAAAGEGK